MAVETATPCVFCRIVRGELTPGVLAFSDGRTAVFPSRLQQPRNRGHMLVVPAPHLARIYELDADLAGPLMTTLARIAAAAKDAFGAGGISIRQNNDPHGGQDVFHLHFHVVPRFAGDGFVCLDGATEVPVDERVQQARKIAEAITRLPGIA
jgi:diadenosine tetraphosphate (Ap4A) HIT family hydrolase